MHSRARKLPRCDNDREAIQKQLNNDFEVQQFLNQQLTKHNNTDAYASLLNSLILHKRQKLVHLRRLQTSKTLQHRSQGSKYQHSFGQLQERNGKQQEIKKNLERQIVEIKKSLNLLKGDIGHLVLRNQSSQLLGSKVNKAKIVAEDQLKRVTLALVKDREEIKLRNQMQKKFNKKLKNVSTFQRTGLTKAKNNHVESQLRKEEIYKKLLSSQQTAQNGEEMAVLQMIKHQVDANNLEMAQSLIQLGKVAEQFSLKRIELPSNIAILHEQIKQFTENLELPTTYYKSDIQKACSTILEQYHTLKESIQAMSQFYQSQLKVKDQLTVKMQQCQYQQIEVMKKFELEMLQGYLVSDAEVKAFNDKLKKNTNIMKTLFALLSYLEEHLNTQQTHTITRRQSYMRGPVNYPYVTQLHNLYILLTANQPSAQEDQKFSQEGIQYFYDSMLYDVKRWLNDLVNRIKRQSEGEGVFRKSYVKQTTYHRPTQLLESIPSCSLHEDSLTQKQLESESYKTIESNGKAKRIKLLEDVDINYYKMIKATMKMEKQNTRKNYEFLRTWKRAKYASRDQILEEKRFEASFSVLCAPSPGHKHTDSRLQDRTVSRQSKTIHSSTLNPWKYQNESKPSTPGPTLRKVRSNLVEDKSRKSRLTDKLRLALQFS